VRKILVTNVAMILLITVVLATPGAASKAITLTTTHTLESVTILEERSLDGNIFILGTSTQTISGDFVGTLMNTFNLQIRKDGFGVASSWDTFTGTVLGKSGTLTFRTTSNFGKNVCTFNLVIVGGTGELANLRGTGRALVDEFCAPLGVVWDVHPAP
jgi:hypothetical protein